MCIYQKVVTWYESAKQPRTVELQQPLEPLAPASADRVAEWLNRQDEAWRESQESVSPAHVEDFFVEDDIQLPLSAAVHVAAAENPRVDQAGDGALESVEQLHDAFKRIDEQLTAISDSLRTCSPHL